MKTPYPITIGELSKRTNCKVVTVRYYEKIGLIPAPSRTEGGNRLYYEAETRQLLFIRRCRELGFHLDEIRELLNLAKGSIGNCAEIQSLTLGHANEVKKRINDLRKIEKLLRSMATQCDAGNVPECPILDVLFDH